MGCKKTGHKNALSKLVKEKGFILLSEASERLNVNGSTLRQTSISLEKEGKIKRIKIKKRFKNGNLNDVWLLHMPQISHQAILTYEMELTNLPFHSPLKDHHCYKKLDNQEPNVKESNFKEEESNIIDMKEYVKVNNYNLEIKEYEGERVITTSDIAKAHKKELKRVNELLNNNKHRLIEDVDYFRIDRKSSVVSNDLEKYFTNNRQRVIYLLTESGYLMLVKAFKDDLSWDIQRILINTYFKMKEISKENINKPIPTGQIESLDIMEMMIKEMKRDRERIDKMEDKLDNIVKILSS